MLWRTAGVFVVLGLGLAIAACAQAPPDETGVAADHFPEGPGVIEETISKSDAKKMAGCRKEAPIGNRVKQWVCGPSDDDREMLSIINQPNN